jgi:sulfite exporter TauE/SafE/copper chaperone CopZ
MDEKNNVKIKIDGMTCVACKEKIEKELNNLDGVFHATVKLESNLVEIEFDPETVTILKLQEVIESLDYKVVENIENSSSTNKKNEITQMIIIAGVAIILYLIINNTIGFNFIPEISSQMGFGLLFVVGLFTSLHCISMCGGINLSICLPKKEGDSRIIPSIMYNSGRVVSYTILGGIVGGIGSVVSFSNITKALIAILAGVFMMIMGLNMLNIFPILRKITPQMPLFIRKFVKSEKQGRGAFVVGLLNGFIPCGPLQAMQIYALGTGSVLMGAMSMFFFSIGTVPLMFGLGALGGILGKKFTQSMVKVSGILVIILGFIMMGRGVALSGHRLSLPDSVSKLNSQSYITDGSNSNTTYVPQIEDGKQIIKSNLTEGRYQPITVNKGIPVKWIINAKEDEINGCNEVLIVPKYNIEKKLIPGENIIEFTPDEEGVIPYSCWMGMIKSKITVERNEEIQSTTKETISTTIKAIDVNEPVSEKSNIKNKSQENLVNTSGCRSCSGH